MSRSTLARYGPHMRAQGYVARRGGDNYHHVFGGNRWNTANECPVCHGPVVLLNLDLSDPRLASLSSPTLRELPVCSCINCDAWTGRQVYEIDGTKRKVTLVRREIAEATPLAEVDQFPVPLPETTLSLHALSAEEMCVDEASYWTACDQFLGGNSFIRVLGAPVWLEYAEEEFCDCGQQMLCFCSIGYEAYEKTSLLPDRPFFFGEGALYFFFCKHCLRVHVSSQSS